MTFLWAKNRLILIILCCACAVCLLFTSCSNFSSDLYASSSWKASSLSIDEMALEIVEKIGLSSSVQVDKTSLVTYFDLEPENVLDFAYFTSNSDGIADEVGIFIAKDTKSVTIIKDAITDHLKQMEISFKDLYPNEYTKVTNAVIVQRNQYIFFSVTASPERAQSLFESYFSG